MTEKLSFQATTKKVREDADIMCYSTEFYTWAVAIR